MLFKSLLKTVIMVIIPCIGFSQDQEPDYRTLIPQKDGKFMYEQIVTIDSVKQGELFNRAKVWFVQNFKSAKDVIQMDDKEAGRLIGNGIYPFTYTYFMDTYEMQLNFTLDVTVKDGKYRVQIYDIDPKDEVKSLSKGQSKWNSESLNSMIDYCYKGANKKSYKKKLNLINSGLLKTMESLKAALSQTSVRAQSDF